MHDSIENLFLMQGERQAVRVVRSLGLSDTQRSELAQRWHAWCRRCRVLDTVLSAAVSNFDSLLPRAIDLQRVAVAAVAVHQTGDADCSAPIDTAQPEVVKIAGNLKASIATQVPGLLLPTRGLSAPFRIPEHCPVQKRMQRSSIEEIDAEEKDQGTVDNFQVMCGMYDNAVSARGLDPEALMRDSLLEEDMDPVDPVSKQPRALRKDDRKSINALLLQCVEAASASSVAGGTSAAAATADRDRLPLQYHSMKHKAAPQQGSGTTQHADGAMGRGRGSTKLQTSLVQSCTVNTRQHADPNISRHAGAESVEKEEGSNKAMEGARRLVGESGKDMHEVERGVSELLACPFCVSSS